MRRLHRVQTAATDHRVGYSLDLLDLFMSKAVAGREKNAELSHGVLAHGYVKPVEGAGPGGGHAD